MKNNFSSEKISQMLISRDAKLFAFFYESNFKKYCLLAHKYVKEIAVAEEIVQEIFIQLWEGHYHFNNVKSPQNYIAKIVINHSLNWLKKQKIIHQHLQKMASLIEQEEQISLLLEEQELAIAIYKEIENLPEQCKKVFKMSRFEGLKYREIAEKLGLSQKTIENHMLNALKLLRRKFFTDPMQKGGQHFNKSASYLLILEASLVALEKMQ